MQGVQGFVSFMFLRQDEGETERRHFVAITTWESSRSYEGWLKSEAFANVHAGAEASLIESTVERYDVLA
jgi:heme-degrading monooxygenase HmoA